MALFLAFLRTPWRYLVERTVEACQGGVCRLRRYFTILNCSMGAHADAVSEVSDVCSICITVMRGGRRVAGFRSEVGK